jgi:hypothetical protein
MPYLHALLMSYYLCDAAASVTLLDRATAAQCIGSYQSVKAQFLSRDELSELRADPLGFGGDMGRTAFLRFSEWQEENAELVSRMKAEARARIELQQTGL